MSWAYFTTTGPGYLAVIELIMSSFVSILCKYSRIKYEVICQINLKLMFNDPKNASNSATKWLKKSKESRSNGQYPSKIPDLIQTEMLSGALNNNHQ